MPMCLVNFTGECGVDTPLYDFVHYTDLDDFSSAFNLWMLKSGNEITGAFRCSKVIENWAGGSPLYHLDVKV